MMWDKIAKAWANVTYYGWSVSMLMQRRAAEAGFKEGVKWMLAQSCINCGAMLGCVGHCSTDECFGRDPMGEHKSRFVTPDEHNNGTREACLTLLNKEGSVACLLDYNHDGDCEENLPTRTRPEES
jgi:hypothetical protein